MKTLIKTINKRGSFDKANSLNTQVTIARMYGFVITMACMIMGTIFMLQYNKLQTEKNNLIANYEFEYNTLQMNYDKLSTNYNYLEDHYDSTSQTIIELTDICNTLDEENKSLAKSNDQYFNELQTFKAREELYNKYDYAIIDKGGARTDITYDQLQTLETLCEKSSIKDEDLYLAWIMTESNGKENAKSSSSTAKGYGQILDGTSKFVYCDLMNKSSWSSSVALDGDQNIEMMVALVDYIYNKNDGNLYDTIRDYRGKYDISGYVASIDSYLASSNKSVNQIALNIKN